MRFRTRLVRLEQVSRRGGRCTMCRGRPETVLRDDGSETADVEDEQPCSGCGWLPTVTEIIEVVVTSPNA